MTVADIINSSVSREAFPVFRGLEGSMVSGREIAEIVGVSPPTVSKWRKGRAQPSAAKLVFLTLILAHWLEEETAWSRRGAYRSFDAASPFAAARRCLELQESYNADLPPQAVFEGSRMFRSWWSARRGCGYPSAAAIIPRHLS